MPQVGANNEPLHERALFGEYGSAWQRLSLLFGVSGSAVRSWAETNLAGGINDIDSTVVGAGEIHVITNISARYTGTVPGYIRFQVSLSGTLANLTDFTTLVSGNLVYLPCWLVLEPDDFVRIKAVSATAGDAMYGTYAGFKMEFG